MNVCEWWFLKFSVAKFEYITLVILIFVLALTNICAYNHTCIYQCRYKAVKIIMHKRMTFQMLHLQQQIWAMPGRTRGTWTVCFRLIMCHTWHKILRLSWGCFSAGEVSLPKEDLCQKILKPICDFLKLNPPQCRHQTQDYSAEVY